MTTSALTAKLSELKKIFPNVKFRITSDNFAGGNSVDEVNKIVDKYQYGHFDGMRDIYENTNDRKDIPQVKYVMPERRMSEETGKKIKEELSKLYQIDFMDNCRANEHKIFEKFNCWSGQLIWREFYKRNFI